MFLYILKISNVFLKYNQKSALKNLLLLTTFLLFTIQLSHGQDWTYLLDSINTYKEFDATKALQFGFQAIEKTDINEISYDLYEINFKIGEVYYLAKEYENSFKFLAKSLVIYDLLPINERRNKFIKKPPWVLVLLGNVYYRFGKYVRSEKIFKEAIINFNLYEEEVEKNFGLNTTDDSLGTLSTVQYDFDQAEIYFKRSLERRINYGKESDIIFSYYMLMDLYFKSNKIELGLEYLRLAEELFKKNKTNAKTEIQLFYSQTISAYASYLRSKGEILKALELYYKAKKIILNYSELYLQDVNFLIAECLYDLKEYNQAKEMILENLNSNFHNVQYKINNYQLLLRTYSAQKRFKDLLSVNDSLKYYLLEQTKISSIGFNDLESQLIISEKQKELNENKIQYNKYRYLFIIFVLSFVAVITILLYHYNYQKEKNSRLDLEKKQIMNELDSKNRELVSKANFIMQRNEFLINLKSKTNKISSNNIKKEITSVINAEKSYEEFDKIFTQVYPEFYEKLKSKHDLSQTYLRLVAYIKMNQNNNEIATLCGISIRTVEQQRYRLSKNLNLKDDQDLNSYILDV